jgi:hypothetical protein
VSSQSGNRNDEGFETVACIEATNNKTSYAVSTKFHHAHVRLFFLILFEEEKSIYVHARTCTEDEVVEALVVPLAAV